MHSAFSTDNLTATQICDEHSRPAALILSNNLGSPKFLVGSSFCTINEAITRMAIIPRARDEKPVISIIEYLHVYNAYSHYNYMSIWVSSKNYRRHISSTKIYILLDNLGLDNCFFYINRHNIEKKIFYL